MRQRTAKEKATDDHPAGEIKYHTTCIQLCTPLYKIHRSCAKHCSP